MKLLQILEENINKKYLLNKLEEMGFDEESAIQELKDLIEYIQDLPKTIKLYRIISADEVKNINLKFPGSHYSMNKKNLLDSHTYLTGSGEKLFIIKVKASKDLIDIPETLANNILYPNEQEITLKNKGKDVDIIYIREV